MTNVVRFRFSCQLKYTKLWKNLSANTRRPKYNVIKKDELNFVRLYFLYYARYVNDLHNI